MNTAGKQEQDIDVMTLLSPESQARIAASRESISAQTKGLSSPTGAILTAMMVSKSLAEALQMGFIQLSELDTIFATVRQSLTLSTELLGEASAAYAAQQITQAGQASEA